MQPFDNWRPQGGRSAHGPGQLLDLGSHLLPVLRGISTWPRLRAKHARRVSSDSCESTPITAVKRRAIYLI